MDAGQRERERVWPDNRISFHTKIHFILLSKIYLTLLSPKKFWQFVDQAFATLKASWCGSSKNQIEFWLNLLVT